MGEYSGEDAGAPVAATGGGAGHKQRTEHKQRIGGLDMRTLEKMTLEELLYYVLVGDGRKLGGPAAA